jgi:hypothetical protein
VPGGMNMSSDPQTGRIAERVDAGARESERTRSTSARAHTPLRAEWASKRTCAQAHLSAAAHRVIGMYLSHALSVSRRPRLSVSLTVAVVGRVHAGDHSGAFRRAPCPVPWAGPRRGLAAGSTASGRIFVFCLQTRADARNREPAGGRVAFKINKAGCSVPSHRGGAPRGGTAGAAVRTSPARATAAAPAAPRRCNAPHTTGPKQSVTICH